MKVNAFLIEIKCDNIKETNRLIRACFMLVEKKIGLKPNQRRKCSESTMVEKKNKTVSIRVTDTY